jgi:hypothetical protein
MAGVEPILFDHGFRPPFFIFMSPCGEMMLLPVGRPVYLCKLLHPKFPRAAPTGLSSPPSRLPPCSLCKGCVSASRCWPPGTCYAARIATIVLPQTRRLNPDRPVLATKVRSAPRGRLYHRCCHRHPPSLLVVRDFIPVLRERANQRSGAPRGATPSRIWRIWFRRTREGVEGRIHLSVVKGCSGSIGVGGEGWGVGLVGKDAMCLATSSNSFLIFQQLSAISRSRSIGNCSPVILPKLVGIRYEIASGIFLSIITHIP